MRASLHFSPPVSYIRWRRLGHPGVPSAARRVLAWSRPHLGLTVDKKTGTASTDREAYFTFVKGTGKCVGAVYDQTKQLGCVRVSS
jgi:hypothetical protein